MMGYASGTISEDELKAYSGANIMLMSDTNGEVASEGSAGGEATFTWSVSWNSDGFTGLGWDAWGTNYEEEYLGGTLENFLNTCANGFYVANSLVSNHQYVEAGCASLV